jgi:fatty-acyl-CoA synthase
VSKWWIPDKVIFIKDEEMPRTSIAKIDKKMLRERYKNILQGS